MPTCPCCEDGWTVIEEEGRRVQHPCFHCGNTGIISEEQARQDRIAQAAGVVALRIVQQHKLSADNGPAEPWSFHAAENRMSEGDYTQSKVLDWQDAAMRVFGKFQDILLGHELLDTLVEIILQEPPKDAAYYQQRAAESDAQCDAEYGWTGSCVTGVEADKQPPPPDDIPF